MPTRRDKTTGLPLPSPVVPATTVCFKMNIPNALEYRTALKGILSDLGRAWTWSQTVGQDNENAYTAAELWRAAIAQSTFDDVCEEDMSCEDVANCIETDAATQAAISAQLGLNGGSGSTVYNTSYIGAPMTSTQRDTVVGGAEFCNLDELFGSVTAIVDILHTNNQDFLDVVQLSDNAYERVSKVIKAIPLLNEVPVDEALDFVSQITLEIKENYDAQYTEALRDTYRCAIFCLAREDPNCEVTFQDLVEYFNDRIGTSLEPINFFGSLVEYFIAGTWSGTTVVDILTLIQLSVWQQASNWTGISLRTLQTVGLLGANNPDPDWEILCEDCAFNYIYQWDFTEGATGWELIGPSQGNFTGDGVEFTQFTAGPEYYMGAQIQTVVPSDAGITDIQLDLGSVVLGSNAGGRFAFANVATGTAPTPQPMAAGDATYAFDVVQDDDDLQVVVRASHATGGPGGGSGYVLRVRVYGSADPLPAFTGGEFL